MMYQDGLMKERVKFLSQEPERLRGGARPGVVRHAGPVGPHARPVLPRARHDGPGLLRAGVRGRRREGDGGTVLPVGPECEVACSPDIVREAVLTGMKRKPAYPSLVARDEHVDQRGLRRAVRERGHDAAGSADRGRGLGDSGVRVVVRQPRGAFGQAWAWRDRVVRGGPADVGGPAAHSLCSASASIWAVRWTRRSRACWSMATTRAVARRR